MFTIFAWRIFFKLSHFIFKGITNADWFLSKFLLFKHTCYVSIVWSTSLLIKKHCKKKKKKCLASNIHEIYTIITSFETLRVEPKN